MLFKYLTLQTVQLRIYEQYKQVVYYNETATGNTFPAVDSQVWDSATTYHTTRSDMRAQGYDGMTSQNTMVVLIQSLNTAFLNMLNGVNCTIIISQGLEYILSTMCKIDKNPTLLGGVLSLTFQQTMITILVMFAACFGFCFKRQAVDNYKSAKDS